MGFVSGGLTNASGSTMQPGSGLLGNAQANQAPNPAVHSPATPQGLRGPQLTASTSASTGAAPNSSRHIFAQLKKEGHSLKYRSSDIAALPGSCSSALQRKSPTVSVSTPNQAQMATTQATTTPRVAASDLIADAHLGSDIVMSNTGMRREEEASANPTTLKGNAATSEQAPTAVQGEKGIIETEPGMYPTGIPAAPPTPSRSTARTSQGAGPAFPSTSNAIVKIGGEDGKLIRKSFPSVLGTNFANNVSRTHQRSRRKIVQEARRVPSQQHIHPRREPLESVEASNTGPQQGGSRRARRRCDHRSSNCSRKTSPAKS